MAANGRLPDSDLMAIPGGRLRTDAAKSWIRLRNKIGKGEGVWICPTSPRTAYRPFADQQYFYDLYRSGRGALAAVPGTSNHGWGLAVDLPTPAMQAAVRKHGPEYGWGIRGASLGSDAPSESWHALYHPDADRHKGESLVLRKPDSAYLHDDEAASRRKLLRARRGAKAKGGFKQAPGLAKQAENAKAEIRAHRKRIRQGAEHDGKGGWKKYRRRERYRALGYALAGGGKK